MTESIADRLRGLGLYGVLARLDEFESEPWLTRLLDIEEDERGRRSLERRIRRSKIGRFKLMTDFDWDWPKKIDRELVEDVLALGFVKDAANVILVGPNGVGKTTVAANIAYQALLQGHTVLRVTASEMLQDLAMQDTSVALQRRIKRYATPSILLVDEVGYLSYDCRHGDLFFEVVSRRHEKKPIVLTTNKPFAEWNDVFSNASCITAMVDRLVHRAEIVKIEGDSYRVKEAKERTAEHAERRKNKPGRKRRSKPSVVRGPRLRIPNSCGCHPPGSGGSRITCSTTDGLPISAPMPSPCSCCSQSPPTGTELRSTAELAWRRCSPSTSIASTVP